MVSVCFVCLGNICRSPTAEAVMRRMVADEGLSDQVRVSSAGTSDYHLGETPDRRAQTEAAAHGLDLSDQRGSQVSAEDFDRHDLLVAMDMSNADRLLALARDPADRAKVRLLRELDPSVGGAPDVPDPYAGGPDGFRHVYDMIEAACAGLLAELRDGWPEWCG